MANLTAVTLTNGQGSGGSGQVSTVDALMAQLAGGLAVTQSGAWTVTQSGTVTIVPSATVTVPTAAQANTGATSVIIDQYAAYRAVAASQTTALLGATGAQYDYLAGVLIVPATTSPGNVLIRDGNGSDITIFTGGATSVADLKSFLVPLGVFALASTTPGWRVTTGANVSVLGIGKFT